MCAPSHLLDVSAIVSPTPISSFIPCCTTYSVRRQVWHLETGRRAVQRDDGLWLPLPQTALLPASPKFVISVLNCRELRRPMDAWGRNGLFQLERPLQVTVLKFLLVANGSRTFRGMCSSLSARLMISSICAETDKKVTSGSQVFGWRERTDKPAKLTLCFLHDTSPLEETDCSRGARFFLYS